MKIIAHRGYCGKAPENTLAAFQMAMEYGADMIELDVLLSQDQVPVVIHDDTLNRTTNGKGSVMLHTLKDLKKLDAGSWFNPSFKDETIPTLEEVFQLVQGHMPVNVEIKMEAVTERETSGVEEKVLELISKHHQESSCVISSFQPLALFRIRKLAKNIPVALLLDHPIHETDHRTIDQLEPSAIHLPINHIQPADVEYASIKNIPLRVYTVNTPVQMKKAQDLCLDGIFTNELEKAITFFTGKKF